MSRTDEKQLGDIVGRLYEAALEPERVSEMGDALRDALGIPSFIMFACDRNTGEMVHLLGASENFDRAALRDYRAHYHDCNPWYQRARTHRTNVTRLGESLIGETDFNRTEFASDWCTRVDIRHMLGSIRQIAPSVVVGTGVHRTRTQGAFGPEDLQLYRWLSDHLGRALEVAVRFSVLEGQRVASMEALHGLGIGMALLDRSGHPVFINALAESLAARSRWFVLGRHRLQPVDPKQRKAFAKAVVAAAATSGASGLSPGRLMRLNDQVEGYLPVTIAPFRAPALAFGPERPVALVQFGDPDRPHGPKAKILAQAYNLSAGEAHLLEALIAGARLADIAANSGVSVNTIRTQLARIFAKTATHSQQELLLKSMNDLAATVRQPG